VPLSLFGDITFSSTRAVIFGMAIAEKKDGYPVISSYWQSQEPRQ
jgi:hypothetical protein